MESLRTELRLEIVYKTIYGRTPQKAIFKNISHTGACLEMNDSKVRIKDQIKIVFTVADRVREIRAEVIWKSNDSCGVKFKPKNNQDILIIDDLIYYVKNKTIGYKSLFEDSE